MGDPGKIKRDSPRRFEVIVAESTIYRDALTTALPVGRVVRGEHVTYLDSIDRRIWILNRLVLDGGHWIRILTRDGTEGWLPASTLREVGDPGLAVSSGSGASRRHESAPSSGSATAPTFSLPQTGSDR